MEQERLDRLRAAMKSAGIDALFVSNLRNIRYLTGVHGASLETILPFGDPEGFVLVQPGEVDFLCDNRYLSGVRNIPGLRANLLEPPVTAEVIARKIDELLPASARTIGFETDSLVYNDGVALQAAMRGRTFAPAEEFLRRQRLLKTPREMELLREAALVTGRCFDHVAGWIRPGMTERQVVLEIENYLRANSEGNSFSPIVAFGETSCNPHYTPSPTRRLERGQMVLLDLGGICGGYCGDMTRMLFMGRADARYREVYEWVRAAQQRCLEGVRPGARACDLDALCRDFFTSRGCAEAFKHGTGHGLGLNIHEEPRIRKGFDTPVEPGMVFTVEPGLYFDGWGGVRIEDVVIVTGSGSENITPTTKDLIELD